MPFTNSPAFQAALRALTGPTRRSLLRWGGAIGVGELFLRSMLFPAPARADDALAKHLAKGPHQDSAEQPGSSGPVTIYTAARFITMDQARPDAAAVAVVGKRFLAVGTLDEVRVAAGGAPVVIDNRFAGQTVMPGFIDQHLHPILGALTLSLEVIATEDWVMPSRIWRAATSPEAYVARLAAAEAAMTSPTDWLMSWGYHALWHGKLTKVMLDGISATRPIMVWHRSCHEFFFNTAALKELAVTEADLLGKGAASAQASWAEGHFWENGMNFILPPVLKILATPERLTFGLKQMVAYCHANGITAYNEPGALFTPDIWKLYEAILGAPDTPFYSTFLADGRTIVDRVGPARGLDAVEEQIAVAPEGAGRKLMFFPKAIKLFADGAIISLLMQMKDGYTDGHHGEWLTPPDELEKRAKLFWDAGYQLHIHVNGDMGLDTVLDILERRLTENPRPDHRTVIVHFANSTPEQVLRIKQLGAIVSGNPYYTTGFADRFGPGGLGPARADAMVRSGAVVRAGIPLSFHSDLPMAPSSPLYLAWCAVNRITQSGRVAAPEERISVDDALRAITINAAHSWRKEHEIGSIVPGKIANLTVLRDDPYKVPPMKLKDIEVLGTMFEGRLFPIS